MKKIINIIPLTLLLFTFAFIGGCDKFESLPLNIPLRLEFSIDNGNGGTFNSGVYCLDTESEAYQDNYEKIKNLSYVKASLNVTEADPNLTVDLNLTINQGDGTPIFTFNIPNFKPSDYKDKAYEIELEQAQIIALNTYFENLDNKCFEAILTVEGYNGEVVSGYLDVVLEAETEL